MQCTVLEFAAGSRYDQLLGAVHFPLLVPQISSAGLPLITACTGCLPALEAVNNGDGVVISANVVLAHVTIADYKCSNGLVHVIDAPLVPANEGIPTSDVLSTLLASGASSFWTALFSVGLNSSLALGVVSNSYTIFSPSNDAMAVLGDYVTANSTALWEVMAYHIVPQRIYASDIPLNSSTTFSTLNGQAIYLERSAVDGTVSVFANQNMATVTLADGDAVNGVVHQIGAVLFPNNIPLPQPQSAARTGRPGPSSAVAAAAAMLVVAIVAGRLGA